MICESLRGPNVLQYLLSPFFELAPPHFPFLEIKSYLQHSDLPNHINVQRCRQPRTVAQAGIYQQRHRYRWRGICCAPQ